jgi:hypothetical protein
MKLFVNKENSTPLIPKLLECWIGNHTIVPKLRECSSEESLTFCQLRESRKEVLIKEFECSASKFSNVRKYQFWRHDNKPIELWSNNVIFEKIIYIHNNLVEAGLVFRLEDYVYRSSVDYSGEKGLLDSVFVCN